MNQKKSIFIGLGLVMALFVTVASFASQSSAKGAAFDNQTNSQQNTNSKKRRGKGNSNSMDSNMMNSNMMNSNSMNSNSMNSNTEPNTNGTPR